MKNYQKSVDILFDAYFKDTLKHGDPCGCAVGNLIAGYNNFDIYLNRRGKPMWPVCNLSNWYLQLFNGDKFYEQAKEQIDNTGYTFEEIQRIEYEFESCDEGDSDEEYMFNGLVAVLNVLKDIHGIKDEQANDNKEKFYSHYKKLKNV